jgi:hypothetical protein
LDGTIQGALKGIALALFFNVVDDPFEAIVHLTCQWSFRIGVMAALA